MTVHTMKQLAVVVLAFGCVVCVLTDNVADTSDHDQKSDDVDTTVSSDAVDLVPYYYRQNTNRKEEKYNRDNHDNSKYSHHNKRGSPRNNNRDRRTEDHRDRKDDYSSVEDTKDHNRFKDGRRDDNYKDNHRRKFERRGSNNHQKGDNEYKRRYNEDDESPSRRTYQPRYKSRERTRRPDDYNHSKETYHPRHITRRPTYENQRDQFTQRDRKYKQPESNNPHRGQHPDGYSPVCDCDGPEPETDRKPLLPKEYYPGQVISSGQDNLKPDIGRNDNVASPPKNGVNKNLGGNGNNQPNYVTPPPNNPAKVPQYTGNPPLSNFPQNNPGKVIFPENNLRNVPEYNSKYPESNVPVNAPENNGNEINHSPQNVEVKTRKDYEQNQQEETDKQYAIVVHTPKTPWLGEETTRWSMLNVD